MPPSTKQNIQANDRLSSSNQATYTHRERVTIADINAGYTLLPAVPGYKYRMTYLAMIAIGGAGAGATDVRILATQAAASVALLITAIAALTRSALNTPPAANNTILADGASYAENDVNTAITVGKTGGALITATHVDFIVDYELIPARQGA
jgi:hypothetical protein